MNAELRKRLFRLNANLAGSRLSTEDAIWLARDVARLMVAGELDRENGENGENELWALGMELDNFDLMPGKLSPAEIVRTADGQLRTWTA
ncbi:hypothetical protein ACWGE0_08840 [Lentzea sp. NPDC054927]